MIRKRGLSTPYFLFSALPRRLPRSGLGCDPLRRELAITRLDWSLAPSPRSEERIAHQNPCGPPPGFRLASPCPGLDRLVSSVTAVTPGPFRLSASPAEADCAHFGFPALTGFEPLGLPQLQTPRPVFLNGTCNPGPPPSYPHVAAVSFGRDLSFQAAHVCNRLVSSSFHPPSGALFTFPSPYLSAIGLETCLVLEVGDSQLPAPKPGCSTQGLQLNSTRLTPTGLSPSSTGRSRPLRLNRGGGSRAHNPTSPTGFPARLGLDSSLFARR